MKHILVLGAGKIGQVLKVRMSWNRNSDRVRRNKLGVDPNSVDSARRTSGPLARRRMVVGNSPVAGPSEADAFSRTPYVRYEQDF